MSKEGGEESSMPHRGKSITKQHTTKRVRKCSQRGGVVKERSGEPSKC